jgi:2-oxoglutarate dehydrogenase E1 component
MLSFVRAQILCARRHTVRLLSTESVENAFMRWGHLAAGLDPIALMQNRDSLDPEGVTAFAEATGINVLDAAHRTLRKAYCGTISIEYAHIANKSVREWCEQSLRALGGEPIKLLTPSERRNALLCMMRADVFEEYLHRKHPTYKRYSGEGSDSMHACLEQICVTCVQVRKGNFAYVPAFIRTAATCKHNHCTYFRKRR